MRFPVVISAKRSNIGYNIFPALKKGNDVVSFEIDITISHFKAPLAAVLTISASSA
jgi:hypothetical protein